MSRRLCRGVRALLGLRNGSRKASTRLLCWQSLLAFFCSTSCSFMPTVAFEGWSGRVWACFPFTRYAILELLCGMYATGRRTFDLASDTPTSTKFLNMATLNPGRATRKGEGAWERGGLQTKYSALLPKARGYLRQLVSGQAGRDR